jgi:hypothetical protein
VHAQVGRLDHSIPVSITHVEQLLRLQDPISLVNVPEN